jgi:CBS domain-containing protein
MKIREIMTPSVRCVQPEDSLVDAASLMRELDVGILPVLKGSAVLGMITDRDITIRAVAAARPPADTQVREVMTPGVFFVYDDQDVEEALEVLKEHQIRRVPVVSRDHRLVGILSLGDIAVDASTAQSGEVLKHVSRPAEPVR